MDWAKDLKTTLEKLLVNGPYSQEIALNKLTTEREDKLMDFIPFIF